MKRYNAKKKSIITVNRLFMILSMIFIFYYLALGFVEFLVNPLVDYGLLWFLSFPPLFVLASWSFEKRCRVISISTVLAILVIVTYFCFRQFNWCLNSPIVVLLLSTLYGFICVYSCTLGLKIRKRSLFDKKFSLFTSNLVLISVGVVFFLFLLEKMYNKEKFEFDYFMVCFAILVLAISFLYVIFGYFSQDNYGNPNSLVFLISASLSFAIGLTFNVFVLEFGKKLADGALSSFWPFVCVWSIFVANSCVILSQEESEISASIQQKLRNFLEI